MSNILPVNIKSAGCAAKIGPSDLATILATVNASISNKIDPKLLAGIEHFEDAAVYKLTEELAVVQTVDFFPPAVSDPFLYGQIAAANALSDIYAMGAKPLFALNILCFPTCDYPQEALEEILKGGASVLAKANVMLAGGHSIQAPEPVYGMSVTGVIHPDKILRNGGAQTGDALVLTKPIGSGVGLLAAKSDLLSKESKDALISALIRLNDAAAEVAVRQSVNALTDVTGFGLIGHVNEMGLASGLGVSLYASQIPLFPQVYDLAIQGFVPAGAYSNRIVYEKWVSTVGGAQDDLKTQAYLDLLYEPQTSGGLLMAVNPNKLQALLADLESNQVEHAVIGQFSNAADSNGKLGGFVQVIL